MISLPGWLLQVNRIPSPDATTRQSPGVGSGSGSGSPPPVLHVSSPPRVLRMNQPSSTEPEPEYDSTPAVGVVTQPSSLRIISVPGPSLQVSRIPPPDATTVHSPGAGSPPPLYRAVQVVSLSGVARTASRSRPSLQLAKVNVVPFCVCEAGADTSRSTPTTLSKENGAEREFPSRVTSRFAGSDANVIVTIFGSIRWVTVVEVPSESVAVR